MILIDKKKKIRLILMTIFALIGAASLIYFEKGCLDKSYVFSLLTTAVMFSIILFFIIKRANK